MAELRGVDLASFQGLPGDWVPHAGKISFAAVKITELEPTGHRYVNPDAAEDLAYLKQHGHFRILYLFGHPSVSPAETVAFFATQARAHGITDHDSVALDIETTDGHTPAQVAAWCREVLAGLQRAFDRRPLVYSYISFITEGCLAGCAQYPLWISAPSFRAGHPEVPRPFKLWAIHQYETSAPIDRDLAAYRSKAEMAAALAKHAAPPPKKPRKPRKPRPVHKVPPIVRKDPILSVASANSAIAAGVVWLAQHWGLHWTVTEKHAILTIVTALTSALGILLTKPKRVTAFYGALSTAAVAASAFGLHLSPAWIAGEMPVASLIIAGILRGHVSPADILSDLEEALQPVVPEPASAPAGRASPSPAAAPPPPVT